MKVFSVPPRVCIEVREDDQGVELSYQLGSIVGAMVRIDRRSLANADFVARQIEEWARNISRIPERLDRRRGVINPARCNELREAACDQPRDRRGRFLTAEDQCAEGRPMVPPDDHDESKG